jgi:hypothetical protein
VLVVVVVRGGVVLVVGVGWVLVVGVGLGAGAVVLADGELPPELAGAGVGATGAL